MLLHIYYLASLACLVAAIQLPDIKLGNPKDFGNHLTEEKYGGFIVQLKDGSGLTQRADVHASFHKRAALNLKYKVRTTFSNPSLFYGVSIQLDQNKTVTEVANTLAKLPEVLAVFPNLKVLKPVPAGKNGNLTSAAAQATWPQKPAGPYTPVDDSPKLPKIRGGADIANALKMADVEKLHALGIKGKGVKIGIIDSGVDYRHPALGGGFGPGFKVVGGYAFVEDDWNGGVPAESPDPLATCFEGGHGTHTAGSIVGQDPANVGFGFVGVAPEASLYAYRVFGCVADSTYTDIIMKAMIKAAEDKVDVLSMSLGALSPFESSSPYTDIVNALTAQGTALVAANGNDGYLGLYFESTPGNIKGALSVGSIQNTKFPVMYSVQDSKGINFQYASVWPLDYPKGLNVWNHGNDCSYAAWAATGSAVRRLNASNTIVIAATSYRCPLATQMSASSSFGVANLLTYDIEADIFDQDIETQIPFVVTTLVTDRPTGEALAKNAAADLNYLLKFNNQATVQGKNFVTGGLMSNYSTFGPTWDSLAVKPQLSAPGGKIFSTWPLGPSGGYAVISGTSMATPFVAGCFALVKSKFPNLSIAEITNLLQSTATPVGYAYNKNILSTVAHQGSGLVNPFKAIFASSVISPSQLEIGDLDDFGSKAQRITIKNRSPLPVIYTVKHKGAGYAEYFPYPDILEPNDWYYWGLPQYPIYGSASFSAGVFTLFPGQSRTIDVTISAPKLTENQIHKTPVFSGFIEVSNLLETYTIPYLGAPYSRQKTNAIDQSKTTIVDYTGVSHTVSQPVTYQLPGLYNDNPDWVIEINDGIDVYNGSRWEFPNVIVNFLTGMAHMQINVLPADTKLKPTYYGYDPKAQVDVRPNTHPAHDTWFGQPSYGWLADSSQYNNYAPREDSAGYPPRQATVSFRWAAAYFHTINDDGLTFEYLPEGDYRIMVSMLKPGSDVAKYEEWETWLSPVLRIVGSWEDAYD